MGRCEQILKTSFNFLSVIVIPFHFGHILFFLAFLYDKNKIADLDINKNIKYLKNDTDMTMDERIEHLAACKRLFVSYVQPVVYSSMSLPISILICMTVIGFYVILNSYVNHIKKQKKAETNGNVFIKRLLIILPMSLLYSFPLISPIYSVLHWYIHDHFNKCLDLVQPKTSLYFALNNVNTDLTMFYLEYIFYIVSFVFVTFFVSIYTLAFNKSK